MNGIMQGMNYTVVHPSSYGSHHVVQRILFSPFFSFLSGLAASLCLTACLTINRMYIIQCIRAGIKRTRSGADPPHLELPHVPD